MSEHHIEKNQISSILHSAKSQHIAGQIDEANRIYILVLEQYPDNVEALRLRAIVYMEKGYITIADKFLNQALAIAPNNPAILNNLGNLYFAQKKYQDAIKYFEMALEVDPNFEKSASNLGNVWQELGEFDKSMLAYQNALNTNPCFAPAWNNLGNLLSRIHRFVEAETLFLKALKIDPNYQDAWNNLGICYAGLGRFEQALDAYNHAIELSRNDSLALNNKGNLLLINNRYQEALNCFEASTNANGLLPESWNGYGYAYKQLGKLEQAERCFGKSIELKHDYAEAWNNLGLTLAEQGQLDAALTAFGTALEIHPSYSECHSNLLLFLNYHPDIHPRTLHDAHLNWAASHQLYADDVTPSKGLFEQFRHKIRLGFVSADFCRHPIAYFLLPLLKHIDKNKFEIYLYANNRSDDDMTAALQKYCEYWSPIRNVGSKALAEQIANDNIDILFDLSGHTSGNNLEAFSLRAAPVQISWLGYPNTTAIDAMDYILSDNICLPEYMHWQFTENILRMPHSRCCYAPPNYAPNIGELPALKKRHITFASFNNPVKLNSQTYQLWSDILKRSSDAKLLLSWKTLSDPSISSRIYKSFNDHGVDSSRIVLLGGQRSHKQVFRDYIDADIALDTFPFSGGLTSCEALWMGLPIVTLTGKHPASRQTAGLLAEIGLERLINFTMRDYVECALELASNLELLNLLRKNLREDMRNSRLINAKRFARDFEFTMYKVYKKKTTQANPLNII